MSFSSISIGQSMDTFFALQKGFSGLSVVPQAVKVVSVVLSDTLGNINTFAITNASLEDIAGTVPPVPLTFPANTWTANETNFYFGLSTTQIRINYDIAGVTLTAQPFNLTAVEEVITINILP